MSLGITLKTAAGNKFCKVLPCRYHRYQVTILEDLGGEPKRMEPFRETRFMDNKDYEANWRQYEAFYKKFRVPLPSPDRAKTSQSLGVP